MNKNAMSQQQISHEGDDWRVLSTGAERDGLVFCHLASTTRFNQQRNGANPVQICDWVPVEKVAA